MIRALRHQVLLESLQQHGTLTVAEMMRLTEASKMTIWRDIDTLAKAGLLEKTHGGARSKQVSTRMEWSNREKQQVANAQKAEIATLAAERIVDGETIFLGPGTTLEHLAPLLLDRQLRIVTNSLEVFNLLRESPRLDLFLIGGEYRGITGAFVGRAANKLVNSLQFSKCFLSANAVFASMASTYNEEEGAFNELALAHSIERYLLVTSDKFDSVDFYPFCRLEDLTALLTDSHIEADTLRRYQAYCPLIAAEPPLLTP